VNWDGELGPAGGPSHPNIRRRQATITGTSLAGKELRALSRMPRRMPTADRALDAGHGISAHDMALPRQTVTKPAGFK